MSGGGCWASGKRVWGRDLCVSSQGLPAGRRASLSAQVWSFVIFCFTFVRVCSLPGAVLDAGVTAAGRRGLWVHVMSFNREESWTQRQMAHAQGLGHSSSMDATSWAPVVSLLLGSRPWTWSPEVSRDGL